MHPDGPNQAPRSIYPMPPTTAPDPAIPFADCLALDQRQLRALTRALRHGFGAQRDALLAVLKSFGSAE